MAVVRHVIFCSHIYFAVGGSRRGPERRVLATVMCFVFVYTWHGLWSNIFYWTLLNFAGIVIEAVASHVNNLPSVRRLEVFFSC
jgi:hypothetical protein